MESKTGKNRKFIRRVKPLHVRRGVRFGIPQRLRFFKNFFVRSAAIRHFCQNVVGRTVNNSYHGSYFIALQIVQQSSDNRYAADTARLEKQAAIVLFGGFFKLVTIFTEKLFI